MGQQDAYLAQVAAEAGAAATALPSRLAAGPLSAPLSARPQQGCLREGQGQGPMGWHKGTCMRAGVWGRLGARLPSLGPWRKGDLPGLPVKRGKRGPVPLGDWTLESNLTLYCTEGSGVLGIPLWPRGGWWDTLHSGSMKLAPGDAPCPGGGAASRRVGQGDSEAALPHPLQNRQ